MTKRIPNIRRYAGQVVEPFAQQAIGQIEDRWRAVVEHTHEASEITDGETAFVAETYAVNTTAPLTGGGELDQDRTLAITEFAGTVPGSVPTSPGGTVKFLRADGTWVTVFGAGFLGGLFGSGRDGSVVFDGAATILGLTPVANVYVLTRDIFVINCTIDVGVTVKAAGYRMFGTGTLTVNGSLTANGLTSTSITGGAGSPSGFLAGGTDGANGSNGVGIATNQGAPWTTTSIANNGGANPNGAGGVGPVAQRGGGGGGSSASAAGAGGDITVTSADKGGDSFYEVLRGCPASATAVSERWRGGTGGGASVNAGGGGGGGVLIIAFPTITGAGSISATGGGGASGTGPPAVGGGGGGGGGWICLVYLTRSSVTVSVAGGSGGSPASGGGNGGAGAAGTTIFYNLSGDGT